MATLKMLLFITLVSMGGIAGQENSEKNIPPSLLECYNTTYMLNKDNRLPHNLPTLIAILRKIENTPGLNMNLRTLSGAIIHRFRQDGNIRNPNVEVQDGVIPYAPNGFQFFRSASTLKLVSGSAILFPNSSLTDVERCTLHYMISSSFEMLERGDEGTVCTKTSAAYRIPRDVDEQMDTETENVENDIEIMSEKALRQAEHRSEGKFGPNLEYSDYPQNHPKAARISVTIKESSCPPENGVIKTNWGSVSAGAVISAIAAAMQPQTVTLANLVTDDLQKKGYTSGVALSNKWIATFAGDLAEVALVQGPKNAGSSVGATGGWNSTALPKWYFLSKTENLEFTNAEIRGGLDGLILAEDAASWVASVADLRLSQILDMYYNARGVFNSTIRACNRGSLLTTVAPNATMSAQAYSAALVLYGDVARANIEASKIEEFAVSATNKLYEYIPTNLFSDLSCGVTDLSERTVRAAVDLTIILDTNWAFSDIQPILATLLETAEVGRFNSNFTLLNAYDGNYMINNTNTILDFYSFNSTQYDSFTKGFDLSKAFQSLRGLQIEKLNREKSLGLGGSLADVVLIVPYSSATISDNEKGYIIEELNIIREEVPDTNFLFLTSGSKDRWTSFTLNDADIFTITTGDTVAALTPLGSLVDRIRLVPKRLINSACGANYTSSGSSSSFTDYVEPNRTNYYRLHPNYFFTSETNNVPTVKIQGSGWGTLTVCTARSNVTVNATDCVQVTSNTQTITVSCSDTSLIHQCRPLFLSVTANSTSTTSYQCTDGSVCRFPDMVKFTVSYENLLCASSGSTIVLTPIVLILAYIHYFLY